MFLVSLINFVCLMNLDEFICSTDLFSWLFHLLYKWGHLQAGRLTTVDHLKTPKTSKPSYSVFFCFCQSHTVIWIDCWWHTPGSMICVQRGEFFVSFSIYSAGIWACARNVRLALSEEWHWRLSLLTLLWGGPFLSFIHTLAVCRVDKAAQVALHQRRWQHRVLRRTEHGCVVG